MQALVTARDTEREARERLRYQVLEWVHRQVGRDCTEIVSALCLADQLQVPREELFAATEYLARRELIGYRGAGPRICITDAGLAQLDGAGQRRSIR